MVSLERFISITSPVTCTPPHGGKSKQYEQTVLGVTPSPRHRGILSSTVPRARPRARPAARRPSRARATDDTLFHSSVFTRRVDRTGHGLPRPRAHRHPGGSLPLTAERPPTARAPRERPRRRPRARRRRGAYLGRPRALYDAIVLHRDVLDARTTAHGATHDAADVVAPPPTSTARAQPFVGVIF